MGLNMISDKELQKIPKVELHRHLDGSVRFATIVDLIKKNNLSIPYKSEDELFKKTTILSPKKNLQEVLDGFWTVQKVLCNYDAIKRVTFENIEDAYQDGVKLLELRFATTFMGHGKNLKNDEMIEAVLDGVTKGKAQYNDLHVGLIHILPRSLDFMKNEEAARDIIKYKKGPHKNAHLLCGVDLADAEAQFNPEDFVPIIEESSQAGLGITIHSGEDTDALAVQKTIQIFRPARIGHGIKSWGHQETLNLIKDKNIHLEVCPTSNWLTQCVKTLEEHPFPKLYKAGISLSLNTDDPHIMGINLLNEYKVCRDLFKMQAEDFYKINKDSAKHSFLDEEAKAFVQKRFFRN